MLLLLLFDIEVEHVGFYISVLSCRGHLVCMRSGWFFVCLLLLFLPELVSIVLMTVCLYSIAIGTALTYRRHLTYEPITFMYTKIICLSILLQETGLVIYFFIWCFIIRVIICEYMYIQLLFKLYAIICLILTILILS